jgi:putative transposase
MSVTIPYHGQTSASTYFITAGVFCKMNLLQSDRMAELFCRTLLDYRRSKNLLLHSFVVMPNHIHLLLTVPETSAWNARSNS